MPTIGPYRFTDTDASRTFGNLGMWWRHLAEGISPCPADADGRAMARRLAQVLAATPDPAVALADDLERLGRALADTFADNESSGPASEALAILWHGIRAALASLRAAHAVPTTGTGIVDRINVSDGGVPKRSVDRVSVDYRGIVGDRQGSRQHHGRPWQALSLWSTEVIEAFASAGNPISAGAAGENLTVGGLDWKVVRPGMLLRIGTVLAETTSWAIPCRHNAQWFADGDFRQMSHERGPVSRIYATVLEPGEIAAGDTITVLP